MIKITEAMIEAAWQAFGDCPIDMCGDHDEEQKKCVVAAVEAALSAGQAQPVAIKPLEWEYVERRTMTYTAFWADGDVAYYINQSFGSDSYYFRTIRWPEETIYDGDDLPSAKAAAQSDYEARIRSALVPPAVPGEVEPLTYDEVEQIIEKTEPAQLSDRGDRIWTRRMAVALADLFNSRLSASVPIPEIEGGDKGDRPCGIPDPSTRDCLNMKEVGGGMDGERYRCEVCGKGYYLDYEEMK